ncbi:hypothetical protein F7D09_0983 [Bifidobacterium leontopitheci]|uniref:Uncharacterized protein n=2 Tax=Bifidobacterium leontopitheci TaxID=2650774 RepID=A0A6I1GMC9_9BIFI|nr:hypothetical protein F7D09_0983 [Bifidobacterium leontopitheci]
MTRTAQEQQAYERFRAIAGDFVIPKQMIRNNSDDYRRQVFEEGVRPNQLWVARHEGYAAYVAIVSVGADERTVVAMPMDGDLDVQTRDSLIMLHDTPLGLPMVAWPALTTEIPVRLLAKPAGEFAESDMRIFVSGHPDGIRVQQGASPRFSMDEAIYDEMVAHIRRWHDMCAELPQLEPQKASAGVSLDRVAAMKELMRKMGMSLEDAAAVVDRTTPATDKQRRTLAGIGISLDDIPARTSTLPKDLLIEVEQPRWRAEADQYAARMEGDARLNLAQSAFALAARRTGHGRESWRGALMQAADGDTGRK